MKAKDVHVGGHYVAKVGGKLTTVEVTGIREVFDHRDRSQTRYDVTNLRTGRRTTFRAATKFRYEAKATCQEA